MSVTSDPGSCAVCGGDRWRTKHDGPIRHGTFGKVVDAKVFECETCGVGYLPTSIGLQPDFYAGAEYRQTVGERPDPEGFFRLHDSEQLERYGLLRDVRLRGRTIAEIGCAGGSFLDGLKGFAATTVGIEPSLPYHDSLRARGHQVFGDIESANEHWQGRIDLAVCFSVIEHVPNPVAFLRDARALLAPGAHLLLSTPNARDILLEIGCDAYRRFFYRSVHTYYFDVHSLKEAAVRAGFATVEAQYVHRFNFGNFTSWLSSSRPVGNAHSTVLGSRFDRVWKAELEESGRADYLYAWLK